MPSDRSRPLLTRRRARVAVPAAALLGALALAAPALADPVDTAGFPTGGPYGGFDGVLGGPGAYKPANVATGPGIVQIDQHGRRLRHDRPPGRRHRARRPRPPRALLRPVDGGARAPGPHAGLPGGRHLHRHGARQLRQDRGPVRRGPGHAHRDVPRPRPVELGQARGRRPLRRPQRGAHAGGQPGLGRGRGQVQRQRRRHPGARLLPVRRARRGGHRRPHHQQLRRCQPDHRGHQPAGGAHHRAVHRLLGGDGQHPRAADAAGRREHDPGARLDRAARRPPTPSPTSTS